MTGPRRTRSGWSEKRRQGDKKKSGGTSANSETVKRTHEHGRNIHERISRERCRRLVDGRLDKVSAWT